MITKYDKFILEKSTSELEYEEFWNDYNLLLKELIGLGGDFHPFWNFLKKYDGNILDSDDADVIGDKLVDLHNKGRIPRFITFSEWIKMIASDVLEIYKYYESKNDTNADLILNNPLDFINNHKISIYRGFPEKSIENRQYLEDGVYKSFTIKKETAINFTQSGWVNQAWVDKNKRNGFVVEAEILLKDIYIISNVGHELECIVKGRLDYTKMHIVKNGEIEQ